MHGGRKYTSTKIQTECFGSLEEGTVNTKLGAIEGFIEGVVFELGFVERF